MKNLIKFVVIILLNSCNVTSSNEECKFFTSGSLGTDGYGSEVLRTYREDMTLWFWSAHDKFGVRLYFSVDEDGSFDDYFWFAVTQKNTWHNISLLQGGPWDARLTIPFAGVDRTLKRKRYYNIKVDSDNYILWSRCNPSNLGVLEECKSTLLTVSPSADPAATDVSSGNRAGGSDHDTRLRQNSIFTFLSGPDEVWWASVLLLVLASLLGVCILLIVFLIIRASDAKKKYNLLLQGSATDSDEQTYCSSSSPDSEMYVKTNHRNKNGNVNKNEAYRKTSNQLKDICAESHASVDIFVPVSTSSQMQSPNHSQMNPNFVRDSTHLSTRSMGGYSRVHTTNDNNIYSQDPKELVRLAKASRTDLQRTDSCRTNTTTKN